MYTLMDAHPVTIVVVMAALLVTPFYVFGTYVFSGASPRKGAVIGTGFLLWGAMMTWVCLTDLPRNAGQLGALIVPACWLAPTLVLFAWRDWFLDKPLSQRWLVGLQVWRMIGAVFLVEMVGENIPGIFAYPAGIGDIAVGVIAAGVLLLYRNREAIPRTAILLVLALGVTDFLSAFFFGFTSSAGALQLFHPAIINDTLLFPTGMIPLFLVPYAIFFHALSWLALQRFDARAAGRKDDLTATQASRAPAGENGARPAPTRLRRHPGR